jgi:hypothetical protein
VAISMAHNNGWFRNGPSTGCLNSGAPRPALLCSARQAPQRRSASGSATPPPIPQTRPCPPARLSCRGDSLLWPAGHRAAQGGRDSVRVGCERRSGPGGGAAGQDCRLPRGGQRRQRRQGGIPAPGALAQGGGEGGVLVRAARRSSASCVAAASGAAGSAAAGPALPLRSGPPPWGPAGRAGPISSDRDRSASKPCDRAAAACRAPPWPPPAAGVRL